MTQPDDSRTSSGGNTGPTDEELLTRFVAGDREALSELVRRYEQQLYGYLLRMLGDAASAEDAFQQVCVRLLRSADTYKRGRPVRPWLYAIATNVCRRLGLDRSRRRMLSLERGEDDGGVQFRPEAEGPGPQVLVEQKELAELIRRAVDTLTGHQREVFLLYQYQDLTYAEIAEVLGRPLGTVKSDMHYALKALRTKLRRHLR